MGSGLPIGSLSCECVLGGTRADRPWTEPAQRPSSRRQRSFQIMGSAMYYQVPSVQAAIRYTIFAEQVLSLGSVVQPNSQEGRQWRQGYPQSHRAFTEALEGTRAESRTPAMGSPLWMSWSGVPGQRQGRRLRNSLNFSKNISPLFRFGCLGFLLSQQVTNHT